MNPVILTLFGEEYAPQPVKPVARPRVKTKKETEGKNAATAKTAKKKVPEKNTTILNGWQPQKQYYTIGEVAGLFNVNTSHIRFWTKEFSLKVRTTKKGDRLYTPEQIFDLSNIYHLVKEQGFTLSGAKAKLKEERKGTVEAINLKQSLKKLRGQLMMIRKELD